MNRLFWKVALAVALPQALVLSLLFLNTNVLYRGLRPWWLAPTAASLPTLRDDAIHAYETRGPSELAHLLESMSEPGRFSLYLVDGAHRELSGRELPPEVEPGITHPITLRSSPIFRSIGDVRVLSSDGSGAHGQYRLVAAFELPSLLVGTPGRVLRTFVLCLLMACATSLLVAYYISSPLAALQRTTHEFASGNLDARAGKRLGTRSDQIADLVRDFDGMAERIRELVYSHKRLLGDVSHELRSPLARMRVALALARRHELPAQTSSLDRLGAEIAVLDALIGKVLTLARLESGDSKPPLEELALHELIEQVITDADYEAGATPHRIEYDAVPDVHVRGNAELLYSALQNVVRNAIHYAGAEPPVWIKITLRVEGARALVAIRDHGPGVPAAALPQLFRPFYRVEDSRATSHGSTGLGLAITERAVALHGGSVSAHNAAPGLLVEIALPLMAAEPSARAQLAPALPESV